MRAQSPDRQMSIGVVGGGAIGLWLAARLARAGNEVSLLARGATQAAVARDGIRFEDPQGDSFNVSLKCHDDASLLGEQDVLVFTVKGHAMGEAAETAQAMIGPETIIVPAMNGVPWWFMTSAPQPFDGAKLTSVDPSGACSRLLPVDQTVGCVVHASTKVTAPGQIKHVMGDGLIFGQVTAATAGKIAALSRIFGDAGFAVTQSDQIRQDIWYKLWGNMTMNPLSAITGATCDLILDNPDLRAFATAIMEEAAEIGSRIGCDISDSPEARHDVTRKLGAFKTSMLQDAEAGKPLEIDPLLAAPQEIARMVGLETPNLDHLLGMMRVYSQVHG